MDRSLFSARGGGGAKESDTKIKAWKGGSESVADPDPGSGAFLGRGGVGAGMLMGYCASASGAIATV